MTRPRILVYVQHVLGVGHVRRTSVLVGTLVAAGWDVLVCSGGGAVAGIGFAGARELHLPIVHSAGEDFHLTDEHGNPLSDTLKAARRDLLLGALRSHRPDVVLVEYFPFSRRLFTFELVPLLEAAIVAAPRPLIASSVRDMLINAPDGHAQSARYVQRYFDLVLVHGDPSVVPFEATFSQMPRIAARTRYTGYVVEQPPAPILSDGGPPREVLVSVGAGSMGLKLLRTSLEARPWTAFASAPWRLLGGISSDRAELAEIARSTPAGVIVERWSGEFGAHLSRALVSISHAGYNTTLEVLRCGVPAVLVPLYWNRETEQEERTTRLAARGLVQHLPMAALDPAALAGAIARAVETRTSAHAIDMNGAHRTAEILAEALAMRTSPDHPSQKVPGV